MGVSPRVSAPLSGLLGRGCTGWSLCGSAGPGPFPPLSVGEKADFWNEQLKKTI